jgi:hypothetical protein
MDKEYSIIPASSEILFFLWGFGIFIAVIFLVTLNESDYNLTSVAITSVISLGLIGLFVSFGYQARHASFTLTSQGLRIGPGIYGRMIPWEKIDIGGVIIINLDIEKEYQPLWRLNGAGLPSYSAGWFKLRNKEKALLFVTDRSRVVYIPTTEKYSVLLSVREAEEFAHNIRRRQ